MESNRKNHYSTEFPNSGYSSSASLLPLFFISGGYGIRIGFSNPSANLERGREHQEDAKCAIRRKIIALFFRQFGFVRAIIDVVLLFTSSF